MNEGTELQHQYIKEIDITEIFKILWLGKLPIISITAFFSVIVVIYSLSLPNIYKSKALLSGVNQDDVTTAYRSYSSLAGLAGINLQPQSSDNNTLKAIDKIQSLSFFKDNILPNIFLPDLMALKSWNSSSNTISYYDDIYNKDNKQWVREVEYPKTQMPSAQESFEVFKNNHLQISEDIETGFITVAVRHQSPYIAKEWTALIVKEVNNFFRIKDKIEAQAAVDYLNKQIAKTTLTEIKVVIAELLQQKTQQLTLSEVSDFYVFEYIDPPAVMEQKSEPSRAIICILGALLGGILGVLYVFIRHFYLKK